MALEDIESPASNSIDLGLIKPESEQKKNLIEIE